mgnify:CR=1 FL=1
MAYSELDLKTVPGYSSWLEVQIQQLSSQARAEASLICVACGKVLGTYIIEYHGELFRLPSEETYAFLKFVTALR